MSRSHKGIGSIVLERITSGQWKPGDVIPSDQELADEFGSTRLTVGRAMNTLVNAGLLDRRRRAGTRVALRTSRDFVINVMLVRNDVERKGAQYRYACLRRELIVPPVSVRIQLDLATKQKALHLVGLHFADGQPYQLEDRWINVRTIPRAKNQNFEQTSPNEWLVAEVPYARAKHVLRAESAKKEAADLLELVEGEPVFVIERLTFISDRTVTFVRLIHPANDFALTSLDAPLK